MLSLAGSQVCQFNEISFDKDILGLDVSVKDALPVHELDGPEDLEHIELDFLEGEGVLLVF